VAHLLVGVVPHDPLALSAAAALCAAAAALASWMPARRAADADPIEALRAE
jgi:ABC-type lipoprotein release transport system permease subunit